MPRISLCMIVKDEERFLWECLESVRAAVDEIVIVDTGSSDGTLAIARASGAVVLQEAWNDDFAAARNVGLEAATGTHILVLDADERLVPAGARKLHAAASDRALAIGMLPLHDADALDAPPQDVVAGTRRLFPPVWLPRFFRNDPRLRYERRVHETLFHDIDRKLAELGGTILPVEAPIAHYGEVRALRRELKKSVRNTRLLEQALSEDPQDGDLAGYMAFECFQARDFARARAIGERHLPSFLELLDRMSASKLRPSPIQLASVLATCQMQSDEPELALATVRESARRCSEPHPNLRYLEGLALERLQRFDEAETCFRDCLAFEGKRFTITVNPGATGPAPKLRLANICIERGRAREALALLEGVAGKFELSAALLRAEAWLTLGEPARALGLLAPLMGRPDPPPDMFALASIAAAALGQADAALSDAAKSAQPERWFEPRRRARLAAVTSIRRGLS